MRNTLLAFFLLLSTLIFSQKPVWLLDEDRNFDYPREQYLTGFSSNVGSNSQHFVSDLKASAKSELIQGIRVSVKSAQLLSKSEVNGVISEEFSASTATFADAEINGLKIDYYYDNSTRTGYAFAYASKSEVKGYYRANVSFAIQKIEMAMSSARQAEGNGDKGRARRMYEEVKPMFRELDFSQSLLIAIEGGETESQQLPKSLALQSEVLQATSRLQSAVVVFIKSTEKNFEQPVRLLEPKLKSELANHGCSFTLQREKADWVLDIQAITRKGTGVNGIYFSYLDAAISLIERKSGKEIYGNNFTDLKGGGLDYEAAGRKAYDAGVQKIVAEIVKSIEK
ncbi:MAG: LPP20 family lipoprotein [Prevotellaceae bacterium]|jgi:hypothetical protein|nr:LPP20 family lipoprotein [Prevotellaceae bacterium]